ncbi:Pentalenene oxygenase [Acaryochloris thomasi RCC1774]|uniref:Pentalenene oxygenase n=1 Tax=Acaryochloris thomasi RCC1774 TaxID=1764569 RepID=A0A2W1JP15_9CYAN|nr:cytochrome P450 [Acaryochloris thomasi]PZD75080.1 Pentalenene oxygenase [Acaryochloris thomasi RCC1774]
MTAAPSSSSYSTKVPTIKGLSAIRQLLKFSREPIKFSEQCVQEYGDVAKISIGSTQVYLFHHPDLIAEILSKQNQHFIKDISYRSLAGIFGNGLLLSDGDLWQRHRRLMQPAFTQERIAAYAATAVEDTAQMLSTWKAGEVRDIHQEMSQLTVKVITRALFGVDITQTALETGEALEAIMLQYYHKTQTGFLFPSWMPTPSNLRGNQAIKHLNKIVDNIIEQRRHSPQDDLLSNLLSAQDEDGSQLSINELRDEVMTLLLAGHETTANALTWTLMLLAQNPEAATNLTRETQSILKGRDPDVTDLPQLPYTEMVLKESMRLYPPAWALSREVAQDCQIGPYSLKKGTAVYFSQWVVHRDARFFKNPEQFLPERWQDNLENKLPRCAYFPFGAGPRVCIGKAFSMMEATLSLAMLAKQFHFTLVPDQAIELLPSITLRPKQGIKMSLESPNIRH